MEDQPTLSKLDDLAVTLLDVKQALEQDRAALAAELATEREAREAAEARAAVAESGASDHDLLESRVNALKAVFDKRTEALRKDLAAAEARADAAESAERVLRRQLAGHRAAGARDRDDAHALIESRLDQEEAAMYERAVVTHVGKGFLFARATDGRDAFIHHKKFPRPRDFDLLRVGDTVLPSGEAESSTA